MLLVAVFVLVGLGITIGFLKSRGEGIGEKFVNSWVWILIIFMAAGLLIWIFGRHSGGDFEPYPM